MSWHSLDMELNGVRQNLSSVSDADREIPTEGQQILLETKFTKFPAVATDQTVGISQSASETND